MSIAGSRRPRRGTKAARIYRALRSDGRASYQQIARRCGSTSGYVARVASQYGIRRVPLPAAGIKPPVSKPPPAGRHDTTAHDQRTWGDDIPSRPAGSVPAGTLAKKDKDLTVSQQCMQQLMTELWKVRDDGTTGLAAYLSRTVKLRNYSFANRRQIELYTINREVTDTNFVGTGDVAAESAWTKMGRRIKADAQPIPVWGPIIKQVESDDGTLQPRRIGYTFGGNLRVFDRADTERDPHSKAQFVPDEAFEVPYDRVRLAVTAPAEREQALADGLERLLTDEGVTVKTSPKSATGHNVYGQYSRETDTITVRSDLTGMPRLAVIAHELGHRYDRTLARHGNDYYAQHRAECEAVAEGVAHAVLTHFGASEEQDVASAVYLASWQPPTMKSAFNVTKRIEQAYDSILSGVAGS